MSQWYRGQGETRCFNNNKISNLFFLFFRTIALLLALGESLETPFRVMDEFDVFLDPVTRKLIIDVLIEVGKKMLHRQFIFITPQDVSNVTSSPLVKILQMKPPERMNIAGAPTQQTLEFSQN